MDAHSGIIVVFRAKRGDRIKVLLTYDNGKEFAFHEDISAVLDARGFFAHPYHSWECGLNENMNGLLRQYFPKGKEIAQTGDGEVQKAMNKLKNRPRKCLGFKTPNQKFFKEQSNVALAICVRVQNWAGSGLM